MGRRACRLVVSHEPQEPQLPPYTEMITEMIIEMIPIEPQQIPVHHHPPVAG